MGLHVVWLVPTKRESKPGRQFRNRSGCRKEGAVQTIKDHKLAKKRRLIPVDPSTPRAARHDQTRRDQVRRGDYTGSPADVHDATVQVLIQDQEVLPAGGSFSLGFKLSSTMTARWLSVTLTGNRQSPHCP
jgi:hypothetical protein